MRTTRQRPHSQHGAQAHMRQPAQTGRKVFNCIVDDSALVAGVKKSTRNGIRQWVNNGQIRLFVPLHALEQLGKQKGAQNRHGDDVRETLRWLDEATSRHPHVIALQGSEDHFEKWSDVEKFVVPRTLFSENDGMDDIEPEPEFDGAAEEGISKLTLADVTRKTSVSSAASNGSRSVSPSSMKSQRSSVSALSPPTSPMKAASSPAKPTPSAVEQRDSSGSSVPLRLQLLFNYILWRIHQEENPVAALESFIFLCNDPTKVNYAKGFEVRTKRLEQLREAINREDRDFKNRQMVLQRENQNTNIAVQKPIGNGAIEVDSRSPPKAPAAMLSKPQQNMIDPDAFGRNGPTTTPPVQAKASPFLPRPQTASPRPGYSGQTVPFIPRGNARGNTRGGPQGRGHFGSSNRTGFMPNSRADGTVTNAQIDPNSFTRPRGSGYTGRGGRKLWVPT